ncbi:LPS-assembly protein LptD [Desulfurobacterium sp.]
MRKTVKVIIVTFTLLYALCARAQQITGPITLTADRITGNIKTEIEAKGNVTVHFDNATIKGDTLAYNNQTKTIVISGNVFINQPPVKLWCSSIKYNLNSKRAEFFRVKGELSPTDFIQAEKLIKISGKLWLAYNGTYTPCCCCCERPDWSIEAKEFKIKTGESFKGKWVAFDILSVPVIISPAISGPIVEKRTTGFLVPKFGYIKNQGLTVKQPFYIVLGRSADLTLTYEKRFKDGHGESANLRYVLAPYSKGNLYYYRIDSDNETNWQINYNHSYLKSDYSYGNIKVNVVSSRNFFTENGTTDVETLTQQYTKSDITYSRLWDHAILNANLVYLDSLDNSTSSTFQKLPEVNFYLMDIPLLKHLPVTLSIDSDFTYFYRREGFRGSRLNFEPALRYTLFTGNIKNSFKVSNLLSWYSITGNGTRKIYRNLWKYRETHFSNFRFSSGKLTVSMNPELSFSYVQSKPQNNIPDFDGTDIIEREKKLTATLTSYFYREEKQVAELKIENGYNFYLKTNPWEKWKIDAEITPATPIILREHMEVNGNTKEIEKADSSINLNAKKLTVWINHYRSFLKNEKNDYIRWGATIHINPYLTFSYSQRYDLQYNFDRERQYTLTINRNCWKGNVSYHWIKSFDGTINYQIMVRIDLLKLGGYQYKYEGITEEKGG